jgi:hypothetical protein
MLPTRRVVADDNGAATGEVTAPLDRAAEGAKAATGRR